MPPKAHQRLDKVAPVKCKACCTVFCSTCSFHRCAVRRLYDNDDTAPGGYLITSQCALGQGCCTCA
jgi:hypothetical protein